MNMANWFDRYNIEILKYHPEQKAIIASGFSETDRVKEAQRLGAGQYIKKPYALEKLGLVVKNGLEKNLICNLIYLSIPDLIRDPRYGFGTFYETIRN